MIGMEWHGTPLHFYENVHEKNAQAKTVVAWLCVGFCHALGAAVVQTVILLMKKGGMDATAMHIFSSPRTCVHT